MKKKFDAVFEKLSGAITKITGRPVAFIFALIIVLVWAISGPILKYSNTWQMLINTCTTIITFLMVFVIQQSQNKDTMALQLKLNELIATSSKASNRLIDVEDITAAELETLKKFYIRLAELAKKEEDIHTTHSIDEAKSSHNNKSSKGAVTKKQ